MEDLPKVTAPTLLLVGGLDTPVIQLNRQAQGQMNVPAKLEVIPGASHLFEEPGKLQEVAELTAGWFSNHFHKTHSHVS
jgi:pimeloyl-ACP methyl ester carboxylesterase